MARLRLLLLVFAALPLFGAVCVTHVEQKGPAGPWVGEVVNLGDEGVKDVWVEAEVFDANGEWVDTMNALTCPPALSPGERATFELSISPILPADVVPPMRAEVRPVAWDSPGAAFSGEGLSVRLVEESTAGRFVLAEIRNDSPYTYHQVAVCANLRTVAGKLVDIGEGWPFPSTLRPGETRLFPMLFDSMPAGYLEFFAVGNRHCCGASIVLDPSLFRVSATRVTEAAGERELRVVGEVRNLSGQDLGSVTLAAHVDRYPLARAEASVGCGGSVGFGATAPVAFTLSLDPGADPSLVIEGIQGISDWGLFSVPVSSVARRNIGPGSVEVSGVATNATNTWIELRGICFNLRGKDGALVGTWSPAHPWQTLAPGESVALSGEVVEVAAAASAEIVAYGSPTSAPPPPIPVPVNPPQ
jgi:hypothetical protein